MSDTTNDAVPCNCGGHFGTHGDQHHPNCDINLPADKRSGPRNEQVEAASTDGWARLDAGDAYVDPARERLTDLLHTTVFHCFDNEEFGLSAKHAVAIADAVLASAVWSEGRIW